MTKHAEGVSIESIQAIRGSKPEKSLPVLDDAPDRALGQPVFDSVVTGPELCLSKGRRVSRNEEHSHEERRRQAEQNVCAR